MLGTPLTLLDAFWEMVAGAEDPEGCWLWMGKTDYAGYGMVGLGLRKGILAHRFSWEIANGPLPEGLFACHHCDNPPCVNPSHLFLGTHQDNMNDRNRKGRSRTCGTPRHVS